MGVGGRLHFQKHAFEDIPERREEQDCSSSPAASRVRFTRSSLLRSKSLVMGVAVGDVENILPWKLPYRNG